MNAGSAGREVVVDPQSPRGGEGRLARRRAVTSSYYDRFGARIKPSPGSGNAPDNLGRLSATLHWIMPGFGPDFSCSDARAGCPGNVANSVEDTKVQTTIGS